MPVETKKLSFFLNVIVCVFSIYSSNAQSEQQSFETFYTQASSSNLRTNPAPDSEMVQKLAINTEVEILETTSKWVFIKVRGDESVRGWLHQSLVDKYPLTLEMALKAYDYAPETSPKRLNWIERAAALAPLNTVVLNKLAETLRIQGEDAQADLVLKNIQEIKGKRSAQTPDSNTDENNAKLWLDISPSFLSGKIRQPIKPEQWQSWSGVPVFLSGPHGPDQIDFLNKSDFGHYNPAFLKWAEEIIPDQPEGAFYDLTQFAFYSYFSEQFERLAINAAILDTMPHFLQEGLAIYKPFLASGNHFSPFNHLTKVGVGYSTEFNGRSYYLDQEALAFWIRRSIDGTYDEFQKIVRKIAKVYYPEIYQKLTTLYARIEPNKGEPVVFTPQTFVDRIVLELVTSTLPCRSQAIVELAPELIGKEVLWDKPLVKNISHAAWQKFLFSTPSCTPFNKELDYFGLYASTADSGSENLSWQPAEFQFEGTIERSAEGCENLTAMYVKLEVKDKKGAPIIWVGLPRGKKPGSAVALQGELPPPEDFPTDRTTQIAIDLSGQAPSPRLAFRINARYGFFEGDSYNRVVIEQADLEATSDGQTFQVLYSSHGYGHYTYSNAHIGRVVAGDIDADGKVELVIDSEDKGKTLLEIDTSGKPATPIPLQVTEDPAVGGC